MTVARKCAIQFPTKTNFGLEELKKVISKKAYSFFT